MHTHAEGVPRIKFEELSFEKLIGEGNYGDVHKGKYFEVDVGNVLRDEIDLSGGGRWMHHTIRWRDGQMERIGFFFSKSKAVSQCSRSSCGGALSLLAIKQIILDDKEYFKYIKREIRILSTMRHPFILQFLGVCEHGPDIFIVTEYLSAGDVTALLESQKDVPWTQRLSIATQLCQAMIYLHAKSIIHRDLKPDNILIDEHDNIRLADFGLARVLDTTTRERSLTICGTDGFIAPEVMLGMNYTAQCDVFSFGMVLAQIITRLEPGEDFWNRQQTGELGLNDEEFVALVPPECPPELRDLTLGCGAFEPDDRPPFTDISEVLKYINTKMFGGSMRRAARRTRGPGGAADPLDKADILIGTLSRKTLRETAPVVVAPLDGPAAAAAAASAPAVGGSGSGGAAALPKDEKSTQMLVFHVMKLVQRSTNEDYSDVPYAQDFLLSFVDFVQPAKLMSLLCQRWLAVPTPAADATNEEREELDRRTKLIRLRSLAFVKMWVSRHLNDFDDPNTMHYLAKFDELAAGAGFNKGQSMTALVEKRRQKLGEPDVYKFATPPPAPFLPTGPLALTTIHPVELARQLTTEMARLFRKIEMRDLLREAWKRKDCGAKQYVDTVTKLALWPASAVLTEKQPARALEIVIELAQHLHDLKNFDGLFAVLKGLNHPALGRLRKTFAAIPAKSAMCLARLRLLEANDYEKHRAAPPTPPAVPHLAASLDEIAYVEASSESRLPSGIINFRRYRHIGRVCGQLQQFQLTPYNLQAVPALVQFLEQRLNALTNDEDLKRLSLKLEPPAV